VEIGWTDADKTDQRLATRLADFSDNPVRLDPPVGFVIGMQADFDIGSKHVPAACVLRQGVQACQRVGGNGRAEPLDRISIVIVVRWLDHHEVEHQLPQAGRDNHRFAPWKQLNESTSACGLHRQSSSASLRNCYLYP
jgi:hypothetical protein